MLKKFTVSNYKNFKDEISLDFSKIGEYSFNADSLSMRLIYGALMRLERLILVGHFLILKFCCMVCLEMTKIVS